MHKYVEDDEHQKLMINKTLDPEVSANDKINLYFSLANCILKGKYETK